MSFGMVWFFMVRCGGVSFTLVFSSVFWYDVV